MILVLPIHYILFYEERNPPLVPCLFLVSRLRLNSACVRENLACHLSCFLYSN